MSTGAGTQAGSLSATKLRMESGHVGSTNLLPPKTPSSPTLDVVMKDVDSGGGTNSGGIGASAKSARGITATRRKDGLSPSPKEGSPSPKDEPCTPQDLERQKLAKLLEKSQLSLSKKLSNIESNLSELEEAYISETWPHGNVLRGWDGFIRRVDRPTKNTTGGNGSGTATGAPKVRKPKITDRIFSLSSASSQVRKDVAENQASKKSSQSKKKKKR